MKPPKTTIEGHPRSELPDLPVVPPYERVEDVPQSLRTILAAACEKLPCEEVARLFGMPTEWVVKFHTEFEATFQAELDEYRQKNPPK